MRRKKGEEEKIKIFRFRFCRHRAEQPFHVGSDCPYPESPLFSRESKLAWGNQRCTYLKSKSRLCYQSMEKTTINLFQRFLGFITFIFITVDYHNCVALTTVPQFTALNTTLPFHTCSVPLRTIKMQHYQYRYPIYPFQCYNLTMIQFNNEYNFVVNL